MAKPKNKPQDVGDLTLLSPATEDAITATLRVRFDNDSIYTRISDSILVAMNPYKDTLMSHSSPDYVAEYKALPADQDQLLPHIYQITNQAYLHMRRTAVDQSLILRYSPIKLAILLPYEHLYTDSTVV